MLEALTTDSFTNDSINFWKRFVSSRDYAKLQADLSSLKGNVERMEGDFETEVDHIVRFISYRSFPEFTFFIDDGQPSEIDSRVSKMTATVTHAIESLTESAEQFVESCQRANSKPDRAGVRGITDGAKSTS